MPDTEGEPNASEAQRDRQAPELPADGTLELRRQVRSLLATIRAIVQRTAQSPTSVEDYVAHLSGRLSAIARFQEIVMRARDAEIDLAELLDDEFLSQGVSRSPIETSQSPLMLSPKVAAALALALHELATNAVKFGALSTPQGKLSVLWKTSDDAEGWSIIKWREQPVLALPNGPGPAGFGFELIRRTLPYEIGARTRIDLTTQGLECDIDFRPRVAGE
jgi:two-component sensor histidine kinase